MAERQGEAVFLRDEMQDAVTVTLKRVDNPAAIGKHPSAGAAFDMDPFYLFEDAPSPYAFFGINPTLFDAPSRAKGHPLTWMAHSLLAWTPMHDAERRPASRATSAENRMESRSGGP